MTEAIPSDTAPRYLLRDRNASYGPAFRDRLQVMGIEEVVTAPRSPWQNPFVERLRRSTLNFQHRESPVVCGTTIRMRIPRQSGRENATASVMTLPEGSFIGIG
jgi:hypothetical protein